MSKMQAVYKASEDFTLRAAFRHRKSKRLLEHVSIQFYIRLKILLLFVWAACGLAVPLDINRRNIH